LNTNIAAADEIIQCRCRAGESWPADCSKAAVQRLQSSGRSPSRVLVRGTQHVSMSADRIAGDGWRERQAGSRRQDMLQLNRAATCRPGRGNLKSTRCRTGSQWSCLNTGVMWSRRRVVSAGDESRCYVLHRLEALRLSRLSMMPLNRELQ